MFQLNKSENNKLLTNTVKRLIPKVKKKKKKKKMTFPLKD